MLSHIYNVFQTSFVVLLTSVMLVNFLPNSFFQDFPFEPESVKAIDYETVKQEFNTLLTDKSPTYIHLNNIVGPESIAHKNGLIYTGLADGRIVEIDPINKDKFRTVATINKSTKCPDNYSLEPEFCGRFLQVRFFNDTLYALEASRGLYKVQIDTGKLENLASVKYESQNLLYNSFAFDPIEQNIVYITLSSTKWPLSSIFWSVLELDKSGQVIAFDLSSGKQIIIFDKVQSPNGLDIDKSRDQLLFAQTTASRISKCSLNEIRSVIKKTSYGSIASGLTKSDLISLTPGFPDNIIVDGNIAYVAIPVVRTNGNEILEYLHKLGNVRKFIGRSVFGIGKILEYIAHLLENETLKHIAIQFKHGYIILRTQKQMSAVLEYNLATSTSRLLGTDHFTHLSEASPDGKGNLYLGSYRNSFMVKIQKP